MADYLPFIVIGLTTGAVYALASLGLVLTYTTSGVFNFAHGAVGMFATYIFYTLRVDWGVPTAVAVPVSILVVAPLLGVGIDRLLLRRLEGANSATYVVASLGLLVGLQGLAVALYGAETRRVDSILPTGTYRMPGVNVGIDQTIIVAVALGAGLGLLAFFRGTRLGTLTRAVVSDRSLIGLCGTDGAAVTTFSWMLGCAFAALSGILFVPLVGLDSLLLTLLVVEAFGAAVLGRLRSFPLTMASAFGLGVAQSLASKIVSDLGEPSLGGIPSAMPFLALFAVLLFTRSGSFVEVTTARRVSRAQRSSSGRLRLPVVPLAVTTGVALVAPPFLNGSQLLTATTTVVFVLLFVSLSLVVGLSRQVSLAHAVFVLLGATNLSHFVDAGVPYLLGLALAALVLVPVGALLAIPAIRLSGLFLALATFGFGVLAQNLLYSTPVVFGATGGVLALARPSFLANDYAFYYFVLTVVVLGVLAVEVVRVTRLGRILIALADSPRAVTSLGIAPVATRVLTFCLSAFLAALAGGLLGLLFQSINAATFNSFFSLVWVTVLVTAGSQTFGGSVLAAVLLSAVPAVFTAATVTEWQPVAFGAAAVLLAQADNGLAGLLSLPNFAALARRSEWRRPSDRALERVVRISAKRVARSRGMAL